MICQPRCLNPSIFLNDIWPIDVGLRGTLHHVQRHFAQLAGHVLQDLEQIAPNGGPGRMGTERELIWIIL